MQAIQHSRDYSPQGIGLLLGQGGKKVHFDTVQELVRESHLCFLSGYLLAVVRSFENRLRTVAVGSKKRI